MEDLYKILGLKRSASHEEVRRAYKILARRYHPDLNPEANSAEKFRAIADAYAVLSDKEKRFVYDSKFSKTTESQKKEYKNPQTNKRSDKKPPEKDFFSTIFDRAKKIVAFENRTIKQNASPPPTPTKKISVVEVIITVFEAISGITKTVELAEPEGKREVIVTIPKGSRTGDFVKLSSKFQKEELLATIKVMPHPYLLIERKGIVVTLPVTIKEAYCGASLQVPTLDGGVVIKIPPLCASGSELRVKEKGLTRKDGTRGDIFYKISVATPHVESESLKLAAQALDAGYERSPRSEMTKLFS